MCLFLATACYARRGLFQLYLYLFIYLFSSFTCFSSRYSSLSCWPILMKLKRHILGVLGFQKLLICAYIVYISKVIATFSFPFKSFRGKHAIRMYMYIFKHHSINFTKFICVHIFALIIKLKHRSR